MPPRTVEEMRNATERLLPRASRLFSPPAPDREAMDRFSRIEDVQVASLRRTQSRMGWEDFLGGNDLGCLVDGYGDHPVVVRMRDGENLLYDGHHRTVVALYDGVPTIRTHVIEAASYAPHAAGIPSAATGEWTRTDDDLLAELLRESTEPEADEEPTTPAPF